MIRITLRLFAASITTLVTPPSAVATALAVPGRRKALAWFSARPFDLDAIEKHLRLNNSSLRVTCTFPGPIGGGPEASTAGVPTSANGSPVVGAAAPVARPITNGGGAGATSATAAAAAPLTAGGAGGATKKTLEMLCFAQYLDSPECETGLRKVSYVVFTEGTIVGWDASWLEMVATNDMLRAIAPRATTAAGSGTSTASALVSQRPLPSSHPLLAAAKSVVVESINFMEYYAFCQETGMDDGRGLAEPPPPDESRNFIDAETDTIVLADAEDRHKVPFAFALAQSVKLDAVEIAITPIAQDVKDWQRALTKSGRLLCTLRQLRKSKAQLLALHEYLNFKYNVQTTPRIFWTAEYQHLRSVYKAACEHLEIEDRGTSLKTRMDTIDESVSYFHSESHAGMNDWLTWVIIFLIAAELFAALGFADGAGDFGRQIVTSLRKRAREWGSEGQETVTTITREPHEGSSSAH